MKNHFIICVFVKRNERNFTFTGLENFFNNDRESFYSERVFSI